MNVGLSHGRQTVFKLDDLVGSLQDISGYFRSASGLPGMADRPEVEQFGDVAKRRTLLGLLDGGAIALAGLWKSSAAAVHGRQARIHFDQYALHGRTRQCSVRRTVDLPETQQFGDTWKKRDLVGLRDGSCSFAGLFNGAAGELDAIFRAARQQTTPVIVSVAYSGFAIGALVDLFQAAMTRYGINSDQNNPADASGEFSTDDRIDLGVSLHDSAAAETGGGTVNYTSVDESAATAAGGVGHLHVTAFTGTNATVKIQDSVDDAVWTDLISFTVASGVTKQRIELGATAAVKRYVRAIISAGTYTSITFAVAFARRGYTYGTAGTFRHLAGLLGNANTQTYEYGTEGSGAGARKLTGECRMSSLEVTADENQPTAFSAELMTSDTVTETTF